MIAEDKHTDGNGTKIYNIINTSTEKLPMYRIPQYKCE